MRMTRHQGLEHRIPSKLDGPISSGLLLVVSMNPCTSDGVTCFAPTSTHRFDPVVSSALNDP